MCVHHDTCLCLGLCSRLVITGSVSAVTTQIATLIFSLHIITITATAHTTQLVKCTSGGLAVVWAWHNCAPGTRGHNHPSSPTIPWGPEQQRSKCERKISIRHQENCCVSIKQIAAITTLTVPSIIPIHNLGWGLAGQLSALWSDSAL